MSEERKGGPAGEPEAAFFQDGAAPGGAAPPPPPPPRARWSAPLLRRSPLFSVLVLGLCAWLLGSLWPDVAFYFSPREPIDLGGPGAYRLEAARENRLVQVRGELVDAVPVREARTGVERTVGRLAGTNLLVDRPGRGGPPLYEGRLLSAASREPYGEVARLVAARGAPLGDGWRVLRDGERPRRRLLPVLGAALVAALIALNVRALLGAAFTRREASR
jgi:hypothetical protein